MPTLDREIQIANTLANICKKRIAVVQVFSIICSIEYADVEDNETVLYVTI